MAMNKKLVYVILVVVLVFEVVIQQMTIAIQKETLQSILEMSQNQQETIYLQEQENEILKQKLKELSSSGTPCRIPLQIRRFPTRQKRELNNSWVLVFF